KPAIEMRAASRQMGRQTVRIATATLVAQVTSEAEETEFRVVIPSEPGNTNEAEARGRLRTNEAGNGSSVAKSALPPRLRRAAGDGATPCHHAIVCGAIGGVAGWTPANCAAAYLYTTAAQLVGAALRLIAIGQLEGQRILARAADLI